MQAEATFANGSLADRIISHSANEAKAAQAENAAATAHERATVKTISATQYEWRPASEIPPRDWLFRQHYIRKFLVATAGPPATAKSSLTLVDYLSMVIGRDLLTGEPLRNGPLIVWLYNTEDPREEIERRVAAACLHYGINADEIEGRLFIDTAREKKLVIAENVDGRATSMPVVNDLVSEILARGIDVFGADPLIHTHAVPENDNTGMGEVMSAWREVAERGNCCVELLHHLRKNGGQDTAAEDMRGATAILGSVRSLRLITAMSIKEAQQFGVTEEKRRFHVWVNPTGKPSLVPPISHRDWYFMQGVDLGNATDMQPSDNVGVATRWTPPTGVKGITADEERRVLDAIRIADPLTQARASTQADGWAGNLVAQVLGLDLASPDARARIVQLLSHWEGSGDLKRTDERDPRTRRDVPVYILGSAQEVCADDDADDLSLHRTHTRTP